MRPAGTLALVSLLALSGGVVGAADAPGRAPGPAIGASPRRAPGVVRAPALEAEPEPGEDDDDDLTGPHDDGFDDGLDDGRAEPADPRLRAPTPRPVPRGEGQEEPGAPGDTPTIRTGPAEPASAAQPLGTE